VNVVKRRKVSPGAQSVLVGVVALLVLLVGLFALVMPQRSKAGKLAKEIASTQTQIAQARALAEQKPAQPIRYADLFKLVKAMPDQTDMTGIILQLNQTATDAGIVFDSIQPEGGAAGAGFVKQPIALGFNGDYYGLADFLFRLRNLVTVRGGALSATGRLFTVDSMQFTAGAKGFPQITAKLVVNAYVYGTGTTTPAPATTPAAPASTDTTATTDATATTPPAAPSPSATPVASGATQ
jgi:Tfp pilus assembly protein PilO